MNNTNPELPVEVVTQINEQADKFGFVVPYDGSNKFYNDDKVEGYKAGATAYATKLLAADKANSALEEKNRGLEEVIKVLDFDNTRMKGALEGYKEAVEELKQWKMEAVELQVPIIAYCHKHLEVSVGDSCTALVIAELDRLREENATLKAQQGGWVKADQKPEHNVGVLVFIPGEDNHITSGMWDISNEWVLLDEYRTPEEEVTHWMPIPAFPEGYAHDMLSDEWVSTLKAIAKEELSKRPSKEGNKGREVIIIKMVDFIRDCATNWDCDSDGHKYNTGCRKCEADKINTEWNNQQNRNNENS